MSKLARCTFVVALALVFGHPAALRATEPASDETIEQKCVVSIERIWNRADHAAFTDIVFFNDSLYCAFREGSGHIPGLNGVVRIIRSSDRMNWESVAVLTEQHVDLRDPKLSITPDGRLMVNMGGSYYHGSQRQRIESRVSFSDEGGERFSAPQKIEFPASLASGADWLWRVTWHDDQAWGCVQQSPSRDGQRGLRVVRSRDGIRYEEVAAPQVPGPSETTLRMLPDGRMLAMIRCESKPPLGRIGIAAPPFTDWKIIDSNRRFGGPNMLQLPGGAWLAGSRAYDDGPSKTQLWWLDPESGRCDTLLTLPSSGDNSYPGFAVDEDQKLVYMSYYSSHEGKTAIYLATLRLDALEAVAPR